MKLETFVEEYNNATNQEDYMESHIVNRYIPYIIKQTECEHIVDLANHKTVNGKRIYWKNSPNQALLFTLRIIKNYTDLDIMIDENEDIISNFDLLNENGIIGIIMNTIPYEEINEWKVMLNMCESDLETNETSLYSIIDTKFDAINLMVETIQSSLGEFLDSPNIQDQLLKILKE